MRIDFNAQEAVVLGQRSGAWLQPMQATMICAIIARTAAAMRSVLAKNMGFFMTMLIP